jgi:Flp pilus assembly protein TadG
VNTGRLGGERGSVVAEFAVALPAVVLVLILGIGALGASARHVRLQDAAADAARLAARGEPDERVHAVLAAAVSGASGEIEQRADLVCVTAVATASVGLPLTLVATSCALAGGV